jgi:hypothetical protein
MTVTLWIAMWMLAAGLPQVAAPIPPPTAAPELEVAVRGYAADGSLAGSASSAGGTDASQESWFDPTHCTFGGGTGSGRPQLSQAAVIWQVTGHIVRQDGAEFVVAVEWHKTIGGVESVPSSRTLMLSLGDRAPIDEAPSRVASCRITSARLEVSMITPPVRAGVGRGVAGARGHGVGAGAGGGMGSGAVGGAAVAGGSGTGAGAGGSGGTGVGAGAATGVGSGTGAGATAGVTTDRVTSRSLTSTRMIAETQGRGTRAMLETSGASGAGAVMPVSVQLQPIPAASYDADVWLVHKPPAGGEETVHVAGHLSPGGQVFEFPSVAVSTARGVVMVEIASYLRPMTTADGMVVLRATIVRQLSGAGDSLGWTNKAIPLPGPTDVVSFETPEGAGSADAVAGHQFSLRVKVTARDPF